MPTERAAEIRRGDCVNLSQLSYLVETVRCGSFSAAASHLYVTPQTISKSLGDLESELGVTLFGRNGRRLTITDDARLLAEKAESVLACVSDMEGLASRLRVGSTDTPRSVSIAVASSPLRGTLVPDDLLSRFFANNPGIEVAIRRNGSESCLTVAQQGLVDAAITLGRTTREGLLWTQICPFVFGVTMSSGHPLAGRERVGIAEVAKFPVATPMDFRCAYRIIEHQFEANHVEPTYVDVAPTVEAHRAFLDDGGVLFTGRTPDLSGLYPDALTKRLMRDDGISIPLCLIYRKDNDNPAIPLLQRELLLTTALRKNM